MTERFNDGTGEAFSEEKFRRFLAGVRDDAKHGRPPDVEIVSPRPVLETERCARCGRPSSFSWDELEGWTSDCCSWPEKALPADAS